MPLKVKINKKYYYGILCVLTILLSLALDNWQEVTGLLLMTVGAIINQFLLVKLVEKITDPDPVQLQKAQSKIGFIMIFKLAILGGAFYGAIQLMGNKIILALGNYLASIFILYLASRNK